MSFSDYKRMHWVVCKTYCEDIERMLRAHQELERFYEHAWERKVSSKEGTFLKESGHDSWEKKKSVNFWPKYFFSCGRPYCTDSYSPYDYVQFVQIWNGNRSGFGHGFRADFHIFGGCFWAVRNSSYNGLSTQKMRYGRGWTVVWFWQKKQGRFLWDRFGAMR